MTKRNTMKHDGIGYVNNRGVSKYWGVSFNNTLDRWFISVHQGYTTDGTSRCKCLYFSGVKSNEKHAAQLAAAMYQYRYPKKFPNAPFDVVMNDGVQYTVYPKQNMIRRDKIALVKLEEGNPGTKPGTMDLFAASSGTGKSRLDVALLNNVLEHCESRLGKRGSELLTEVIKILES